MNSQRIEQIKQGNNIKDIVADFGISLKANRGKCPFCDNGSGAFSVNQDYYNCFKCGAKGDIVEFVQQSQNLDFIGAMKFLGARAGISTEESITKTAGNQPKAAAIMYLNQERGLDISENWYSQETFGYGDKQSATVRFALGETCWERIIDAHLFNRKANFGGKYKGESWQPPSQRICKNDRIYITEGIFDAIALLQSQKFKVASAMSTSNFPQKLIDKHRGKKITWCLALDNGDAGSAAAKKWTAILRTLDEKVEVYYPQNKKDWNDLYRTKELTADLLKKYWWRGQILVAQSAAERMAWLIIEARVNKQFIPTNKVLSFKNCYFNCKIFEQKDNNKEDSEGLNESIENGQYFEAVNTIKPMIASIRISTATASLLYTQIDNIDQTYSYYFDVAMLGVKKRKKVAFDSNMITDAKAFNLALLKRVGQSTFSGESCHMRQILDGWFANRKPTIETIRHMGYSPTHKAYIFENFGYKDGHFYKTNKHDYLNMGSLSLKTTFSGWNIPDSDEKSAWFNDLFITGGNNALTGVAFWLMSLFATQVRAKNNQGTIPFFEYTGVAHSGKSTIIEFLWKLIGREGHEGEDPEKMTFAALARYLMQAANIPAVLLEGDRDPDSHHRKKFSMDNMKTMFRGQSPYGRGVRNNGIDIDNVPFLGTLVISQNAAVDGEPQILSRIVQCIATKKDFSNESLAAANRLKRLNGGQVIHFLHDALSKESQIMQEYESWFEKYKDFLFKSDKIHDARIAENHAQIMAFGKCLKLIVPELDDVRLKNWLDFMVNLAENRQLACQSDPALIHHFWEIYETFNEKVFENNHTMISSEQQINHSKDPDLIAINLPLFKKIAEENRQQIDIDAIKRLLINSKRYKFVNQKKVDSAILGKIIHCWIFKAK
jgi:hypothetical protein